MPPQAQDQNANLCETPKGRDRGVEFAYVKKGSFGIVYQNAAFFIFGQILWFYSYYHFFSCTYTNWIWVFFLAVVSGFGVTCGAHRLWAHRSYKAKLPLRIFLAIGQSIAGQNCLFIWCRDHRVHHKFSDTDADPHNSKRGVFFSHVGWLLHRKHPDVIEQGKKLNTDDLLSDPVVYWQQVLYYPIYLLFAFFIPVAVPVYFWNETLSTSFFVNYIFRHSYVLHGTWFVNSAAHLWGLKEYDAKIPPADNTWVSCITLGEGYHNYHHTFPYDYSTSELPVLPNVSKSFIDLMSYIGQAYDLKRASDDSIESRKHKTAAMANIHNK